jgi:ferric-dicitrate binding protein FerR (iron transport regulator)
MEQPVDDLMIERYLAGECSESERATVHGWIDAKPSRATYRAWETHRAALAAQRARWRTDEGWTTLHSALGAPSVLHAAPIAARIRFQSWSRPLLAFAATLLLVAGGMTAKRIMERASVVPGHATARVATTGRGERRQLRLDDGSVVMLGPESSIRYTLEAGRTDVLLAGLAHFNVRHDATRAFTVRAGDVTTTDLGTEFVIRAYGADSNVAIAVASGRVGVALSAEPRRSVDLVAGDVALRLAGKGLAVRHDMDLARYTEWVQGRLAFENQTLREVATDLSRWFDLDVRVPDTILARRRITAVYDAPSAIDVLDAISAGLGVKYDRQGKVVTLRLPER